jgi:hypothetical protein
MYCGQPTIRDSGKDELENFESLFSPSQGTPKEIKVTVELFRSIRAYVTLPNIPKKAYPNYQPCYAKMPFRMFWRNIEKETLEEKYLQTSLTWRKATRQPAPVKRFGRPWTTSVYRPLSLVICRTQEVNLLCTLADQGFDVEEHELFIPPITWAERRTNLMKPQETITLTDLTNMEQTEPEEALHRITDMHTDASVSIMLADEEMLRELAPNDKYLCFSHSVRLIELTREERIRLAALLLQDIGVMKNECYSRKKP